ncbi:MAG: hypothetical protein C0594_11730 [Marinilabiliales bacterium]|nr:MAG: hypothetical protein C0594_11730 [Marinilabiliales bacterium]
MKFIWLYILVLFAVKTTAQRLQQEVKWFTIEEAQELVKKQPKKILIDMYTDWCGWCKKMDAETFKHPNIAAYINQYFYAVKFDAETADTIVFNGKTYVNEGAQQILQMEKEGRKGRKPTHNLAKELMNNKMSFPTIVYLDEHLNNLSPVPGYKSPSNIEPFIMYFGENVYKSTPFDQFNAYFQKAFKTEPATYDTTMINWMGMQEAIDQNAKEPKMIFLDIYTPWASLSKLMFRTTYTDSIIAKYINENFYAVHFNALSKDTITMFDGQMVNEGKAHPYHSFAVSALQGKMIFPSFVFIDGNNKLITAVPEYRSPQGLEPILKFIREGDYKTEQFQEYLKTFKSSY